MVADQNSPLLEVDGLSLRFGERVVLDKLSLTVRRGEIFGLLGPNGSGKSTTFSILTGLLTPQAGTLRYDGAVIKPGDRRLRTKMGVVFQKPSLDPNLSCAENLRMAGALYRVPKRALTERVSTLLEFADLSDRIDERVQTLSGGMRRRLELARSLIHYPEFLIMDEPTTGLDEISFHRTWKRLHALCAKRHLTILMSTHRPEEAAHCHRLAMIDKGAVAACDTPEALQRSVSGDVITLEGADHGLLAEVVRTQFNLEPRTVERGVAFTCEQGHALIPRIVEALPKGVLTAVYMKRPSLADVFLKLTGHDLDEDQQ